MQSVYQRQAESFDRERDKGLFEKNWLEKFAEKLPVNGTILDIGCGSGQPIAAYFIERSYKVTGLDYSNAMLALAKARWPKTIWIEGDMRWLSLGQKYDGVIAWNSFFHLSPDEQINCLPLLLSHVRDGGVFMTTTGADHGETEGIVAGEKLYHGSLSPSHYKDILSQNGFHNIQFKPNDPDCNGHCVLLATKAGAC